MTTLDAIAGVWAGADENRRAAALRALTGEPAQAGPGRLLTVSEAAQRLGYSRGHLHRIIRRGKLRTVRPYDGALPRVLESDVLAFANGRAG